MLKSVRLLVISTKTRRFIIHLLTTVSHRFYSSIPIDSTDVTLEGAEARHLKHVMRAVTGDEVVLFDGRGTEFVAEITSTSRQEVQLVVRKKVEIDRESAVRLTIAVALPKGDRQKFLVEKCVELGVSTLVPIITEHGVARPSDAVIGKLQRAVIEASKQCGRNWLMQVSPPQNCQAYFQSVDPQAVRWIAAVPRSEAAVDPDLPATDALAVYAAVGPEGGFTSAEMESAASLGWQPISLGPRTLRVETAALLIAALCGAVKSL